MGRLKKKKILFIMEIFKSGSVVKPLGQSCLLLLPHPAHILSVVGTKQEREREVPLGRVGQAIQLAWRLLQLCGPLRVLECN